MDTANRDSRAERLNRTSVSAVVVGGYLYYYCVFENSDLKIIVGNFAFSDSANLCVR